MAKQTTRDAALSRLFGNSPDVNRPEEVRVEKQRLEESTASSPEKQKKARRRASSTAPSKKPDQGRGEVAPTSEPKEEAAPSGYIGLGRYSRSDGVVERITPYVRPDQAEALRVAVARKSDPRGRDISQIIQTLLDEAGYRG